LTYCWNVLTTPRERADVVGAARGCESRGRDREVSLAALEYGLDEKVRYLGRQRGGKRGQMPKPEAAGRCAR
jgi:hypothetical protein